MNHVETNQLQRIRTMHLFAGAGGGILADILLDHQPVCAVEIEPYCQQVLAARQRDCVLPWFPIFGDIRKFDGKPWRGVVDVICGGFPCIDISIAGSGRGIEGEHSGLWREMARVIREVGPRFVFVENTAMLASRGMGAVLGNLATMGYDARWGVLSACACRAPHTRERMWILADSNGISGSQRGTLGRARRLLESIPKDSVWEIESSPTRLPEIDVLANRLDELKSIGNGQVPLVAATAWRILSEQLCAGTSG